MNRKAFILSLFLPFLATIFLLVVSGCTSPLCHADGGDSTIYKLLGLGIVQGRLPYVDLFDNKGTYLYLINALGQWLIPGRWGLFLLQIVSLTTTLILLFRTARLCLTPAKSLLAVILSLFLLAGCYQGGNHVEEWMLPFLAWSFYLAADLLNRSRSTITTRILIRRAFIWGICFGIVLLLRPNDAVAFFGGIFIGLILWLLYHRKTTPAIPTALLFLAGTLLAVIPIVIWFACHGALNDLWYGMFGANSQVAGGIIGQLKTLLTWGKWAILLLMVTLCVMIANTSYRSLFWVVIPICLLQLTCIGGKMYAHYFIPLFPLIVLYMTMLLRQRNLSVTILAVAILCLSHRPLPRMAVFNIVSSIKEICKPSQDLVLCPIPAEERTSVWNYSADPWRPGIPMAWLVNNGVVQCNRKTGSLDVYVNEVDFQRITPLWVVSYGDEFEKSIYSGDYQLADSIVSSHYILNLYRQCRQ